MTWAGLDEIRSNRAVQKSRRQTTARNSSQSSQVFLLFKDNPRHPTLGVKRFQGMPDVWEGRVDIHYRFTFHYEGNACVFRNIGLHEIIEREP